MRLFFALILMVIMLPYFSAEAQNIFALPEKETPKSGFIFSAPVDPNVSPLYDVTKINTTTANKSALLNKFFTDCTNRNDGELPPDGQEMLCACIASGIDETMDIRQARNLFDDGRDGEKERVDLMVNLYTPCLEIPISDLMTGRCNDNKHVKEYEGFVDKICGCTVKMQTEKIIKNVDNRFIRGKYKRVTDVEPLKYMLSGLGYQQQEKYARNTCINKHRYN